MSIKRALISVSDKTGVVEFAQALHELDIEILSTGGTAKLLQDHHIPVIEVSDHTGFPEMMAGRVKTLHPKIHGGLLGRRGVDDQIMKEHDIPNIDLLVVNLYPFQKVTANEDCDLATAIENIDIGGPAMLRSAAKNYKSVTVVVNSNDYQTVLNELRAQNSVSDETRFDLALKVFEHTAQYDGAIANYFGKIDPSNEQTQTFSRTINLHMQKAQDMRYGENPHQNAALYIETNATEPSIATAKQLQGKALSYNNVADSDAALECVKQFEQAACVIVKHANPCGVALAESAEQAYDKAYQTDPTSAFGGIIAFNHALDAQTAKTMVERQFVEVVIAPSVSKEALAVFSQKQNIRVLETGTWGQPTPGFDFKRINNGLLVQDKDLGMINEQDLKTVSKRSPNKQELKDLIFAWKVAKFVKSNAIVYCRNLQTIGIGAGQMSRVYSAKIAGIKANDENLEVCGSVMASDAFFPFRDGIDAAKEAGIQAIIQPGGSMRDEEVIQAADEHGMAMVFTGMRHFRH